jgi:hypothetical protein
MTADHALFLAIGRKLPATRDISYPSCGKGEAERDELQSNVPGRLTDLPSPASDRGWESD